jgi:hypothetical protein
MPSLNFNANEVEPTDFDVLPAGKYFAMIVESEMKPTSAGTGRYLQLTFQILEGPCKNRRIWARLNLENPNQQAVQIARGELSAICRAVGVMTPKDSCELHNLPLIVNVKCRKRQDTGDIENRIASYAKKDGAAQPQQAAANTAPPWKR